MRTCPKCGAYYSDVQLAFCLADGTPLADVSPHSEKWSNGSRTIEEKAKRLRNQKRKLMRRWILVGAMTTLTLTMAVANSFTVETTTPRDKPPIPVPSASSSLPVSQSLPESAFWPTPPSPSASPSPSLSVSPSPTLVHKISGRVMSAGQPIGGIKIMLEGSLPTSTTPAASFCESASCGPVSIPGPFGPTSSAAMTPRARIFQRLLWTLQRICEGTITSALQWKRPNFDLAGPFTNCAQLAKRQMFAVVGLIRAPRAQIFSWR